MNEPAQSEVLDERSEEQRQTDARETWVQFQSMLGMWTGQMDEYGGAEEFARKLRHAEDPFA